MSSRGLQVADPQPEVARALATFARLQWEPPSVAHLDIVVETAGAEAESAIDGAEAVFPEF